MIRIQNTKTKKTKKGEYINNTVAGAMILIARYVHGFRTGVCLLFTLCGRNIITK